MGVRRGVRRRLPRHARAGRDRRSGPPLRSLQDRPHRRHRPPALRRRRRDRRRLGHCVDRALPDRRRCPLRSGRDHRPRREPRPARRQPLRAGAGRGRLQRDERPHQSAAHRAGRSRAGDRSSRQAVTARRRFRRLRLVFVAIAVLVLLGGTLPGLFIGVSCYRPFAHPAEPPAETLRPTAGVPNYARERLATRCRLPAWCIAYRTDEYAAFLTTRPRGQFPWLGSISQFWRIYHAACRATRYEYAFDPGVHLMLGVIGVSFSAEQAVKGAYETTLGRLAESLGGHRTEEDAFARRTTAEYGHFMHTVPGYEFSFATKLRSLCRATSIG